MLVNIAFRGSRSSPSMYAGLIRHRLRPFFCRTRWSSDGTDAAGDGPHEFGRETDGVARPSLKNCRQPIVSTAFAARIYQGDIEGGKTPARQGLAVAPKAERLEPELFARELDWRFTQPSTL
jgi:hypothetical protein